MNIRSLIKLIKAEISKPTDLNYDNHHEYKLEVWHGPEEMPFHEAAYFTREEMESLCISLKKLWAILNAENK